MIVKGARPSYSDIFSEPPPMPEAGNPFQRHIEVAAGTAANPAIERMKILVEFEAVPHKTGNTFLYMVSKT
jgi:hypothetical protein